MSNLEWNPEVDEKELIESLPEKLNIFFEDLMIINSRDIRKLLIIAKKVAKEHKQLTLYVYNKELEKLFKEMRFDELGIVIQRKDT